MQLFTPAETAENYAAAGAAKTRQPAWRLLLLGILAGFFIAMGAAVTNTASHSLDNVGAGAGTFRPAFPLRPGHGSPDRRELFTGNTLISLSVLDRQTTVGKMLRNWLLVYLGNFIGALLTAAAAPFPDNWTTPPEAWPCLP